MLLISKVLLKKRSQKKYMNDKCILDWNEWKVFWIMKNAGKIEIRFTVVLKEWGKSKMCACKSAQCNVCNYVNFAACISILWKSLWIRVLLSEKVIWYCFLMCFLSGFAYPSLLQCKFWTNTESVLYYNISKEWIKLLINFINHHTSVPKEVLLINNIRQLICVLGLIYSMIPSKIIKSIKIWQLKLFFMCNENIFRKMEFVWMRSP